MARGYTHGQPPVPSRTRVPLLVKGPAAPESAPPSWRQLLLQRWPGRLLLTALGVRLLMWGVEALSGGNGVTEALNLLAGLGLLISLAYFLARFFLYTKRRFLWRVRRRLIISYVLIGVVPALLIGAFFLFGGALMFLNVTAYLFKSSVNDLVDEARVAAQAAAEEIARNDDPRAIAGVFRRRIENNRERYPGLSLAYIPRATSANPTPLAPTAVAGGEWSHTSVPPFVPVWVSAGGFGGILAASTGDPDNIRLVIRAVGFSTARNPTQAVVVDIPVDDVVLEQLHQSTGIEPGLISLIGEQEDETARPLPGKAQPPPPPDTSLVRRVSTAVGTKWLVRWVIFFDFTDWNTSQTRPVGMSIRLSVADILERISSAQGRVLGRSIGEWTVFVLSFIALLFLIIETAAFVMGLTLARSMTGAIHELFDGTERVRQGDFVHRIAVKGRDQLGELAESFNAMTANIEDLLVQAQEKRRLEEELRIAREIQMSLLPRGAMQMAGLSVTALCVPAREVGGDYYDFFPLDDHRVGLLIADVAGKGTSAAFYMAELKGLVLSLSRIYESPRQLLIEVNNIISDNIDSRSFITMTYAMVDVRRRTVTYARAGHTPLIYLPSANGARREAKVITPSGMVVGLRIEGLGTLFETNLEEVTLPFSHGDVFCWFTDGITEAMNDQSDFFGEDRLRDLVTEHAELSSEELRERIMREVEAFVGDADAHDDMTMILLKVEDQALGA